MNRHRLRAPSTDGALLAEPPLAEAGARLAANRTHLAGWDHDFQGRRAGRLRSLARRQVYEQARHYLGSHGLDVPDRPDENAPLIVTGHQPELFHPGVWIKNFAAAAIAREAGGVGLNLVVDNDILKSASIRVPEPTDRGLTSRRVEFDDWAGEIPIEELRVRDEQRFSSFADRAGRVLDGAVADPLIHGFWPHAVAQGRRGTDRLGLRFGLARRSVEASWGTRNLEVPLSAVCETEPFLWFAAHLLAQLPRFRQIHNEALATYRALYRIRSKHHPVPALAREGDWLEAPFWGWRGNEPRRRPLMVRQLARTMQLRLRGDDAPLIEIPLALDREACCAVEQLRELPARRIRLRTRALTTTMFARYLLGDLFIHGIGGSKYDELGDAVARSFFGIEPPSHLTLSLTLWLDLQTDPAASPERLKAIERQLRDMTYNPDRVLAQLGAGTDDGQRQAAIDAKRVALAAPVGTSQQRLHRFRALRRANDALQVYVEAQRADLQEQRRKLLAGLHRNALAHHREYALVLHSRSHLQSVFGRVVPAAFAP